MLVLSSHDIYMYSHCLTIRCLLLINLKTNIFVGQPSKTEYALVLLNISDSLNTDGCNPVTGRALFYSLDSISCFSVSPVSLYLLSQFLWFALIFTETYEVLTIPYPDNDCNDQCQT